MMHMAKDKNGCAQRVKDLEGALLTALSNWRLAMVDKYKGDDLRQILKEINTYKKNYLPDHHWPMKDKL